MAKSICVNVLLILRILIRTETKIYFHLTLETRKIEKKNISKQVSKFYKYPRMSTYFLYDAPGVRSSIPRKFRTCCFVAGSLNIFWMYTSNAARLCSSTLGWEFLTFFGGNGATSAFSFFSCKQTNTANNTPHHATMTKLL